MDKKNVRSGVICRRSVAAASRLWRKSRPPKGSSIRRMGWGASSPSASKVRLRWPLDKARLGSKNRHYRAPGRPNASGLARRDAIGSGAVAIDGEMCERLVQNKGTGQVGQAIDGAQLLAYRVGDFGQCGRVLSLDDDNHIEIARRRLPLEGADG